MEEGNMTAAPIMAKAEKHRLEDVASRISVAWNDYILLRHAKVPCGAHYELIERRTREYQEVRTKIYG